MTLPCVKTDLDGQFLHNTMPGAAVGRVKALPYRQCHEVNVILSAGRSPKSKDLPDLWGSFDSLRSLRMTLYDAPYFDKAIIPQFPLPVKHILLPAA